MEHFNIYCPHCGLIAGEESKKTFKFIHRQQAIDFVEKLVMNECKVTIKREMQSDNPNHIYLVTYIG